MPALSMTANWLVKVMMSRSPGPNSMLKVRTRSSAPITLPEAGAMFTT